MKTFPILSQDSRSRDIAVQFRGYNAKLDCGEGEFADMENMTSDYFPMLSPRDGRYRINTSISNFQGMLGKEVFILIYNNKLYIDFTEITLPSGFSITSGAKTIETMGSRVIIFPDKIMYDRESRTWTHLNAYALTNQQVLFTLYDGETAISGAEPTEYYDTHDPTNGAYKYDKQVDGLGNWLPCTYYKYSEQTASWLPCNNLRYRIFPTDGLAFYSLGFRNGDYIKITTLSPAPNIPIDKTMFPNIGDDGILEYSYVKIELSETNYGVAPFLTFSSVTAPYFRITGYLSFEREVPTLDFVTEYNNRLWGVEKSGHEIWACKLGDPCNWNAFEGISTDSWRATVGSDGEFTSAITYGGYPTLFKAHSLIKIAVSSTGAHSYKEVFLDGVEQGSGDSIREIANVLYYKGERGIFAYNGGSPVCISDKLDNDKLMSFQGASAGDLDGKYYISMFSTYMGGSPIEFIYDTDTGIWTKRTALIVSYSKCKDTLIYLKDGYLYTLDSVFSVSKTFENTNEMDWSCESGNIGYYDADHKYLLRLSVRMALPSLRKDATVSWGYPLNEASVSFYIQYDSDGRWEHIYTLNDIGVATFTIPIRPRRCDHFKYRIEGRGLAKIISITKTVAGGSDR